MLFDIRHSNAEKARCLECDTIFERSEPCEGYDAASHNPNELTSSRPSQRSTCSSDPEKKDDDWLTMPGHILPSAKSLAVKAQLLNWFSESPDCKCIIFSQFISMLKVLGRVANAEGWDYKYFVGTMTMDQREKAINEFRGDPNIKLMLASLKCGGLGLNLTMANRVIIVDPWWNQGVEDQAWSRVYRIGQENDVEIRRICVRDTIDTELLLRMQERKTEEISRTIDENELPAKLSVTELVKLFGSGSLTEDGIPTVDDDGDAPFIFVKDAVVHDDSDAELPDTAPPPPFE